MAEFKTEPSVTACASASSTASAAGTSRPECRSVATVHPARRCSVCAARVSGGSPTARNPNPSRLSALSNT